MYASSYLAWITFKATVTCAQCAYYDIKDKIMKYEQETKNTYYQLLNLCEICKYKF